MPMSIKELEQAYRRTYRRLIAGILIAHGASLLIVLTLLVSHPRIATWMSKAVQTELAGTSASAQPGKGVRTTRVD